ncbi:patatin-like phospholipase family protein [Aliivibrio fischeri]|uniref:Patatin family protein n=2 Tax=Aliivibrio fischeri TaxID=668 RepID=A0A844P881_ALIFS|nr:DUF6363 domain-containing protein [Aliivibrio fischeri]MUK51415.1 patatin family protein [Aliivibrio fischeri]
MTNSKIKKSIIVEGGAMKGIFASGVLDSFFDNKYNDFDIAIGVSSGAINLASWLSGQRGRSNVIITDFAQEKSFISYRKFFLGGHLIDLDWLWKTKQSKYPLNIEGLIKNKTQFYVVTSDVTKMQTLYESVDALNCDLKIKASCALPFLYKNKLYFNDSRRQGDVRNIFIPKLVTKYMMNEFSNVELIINQHNQSYNGAIDFITCPPKDCKINAIYTDFNFNVGLLTTNINYLNSGYDMGYRKGEEFIKSLDIEL